MISTCLEIDAGKVPSSRFRRAPVDRGVTASSLWNWKGYFRQLIYLLAALAAWGTGANLASDYAYAADMDAPAGITTPAANPLLTPPTRDGEKVQVQVGLEVINLSDINEVAQRFRVVAYLRAEWRDTRLAFTPKAAWETFRVYRPDEVWTPHFDFANGVVPHSAFDVTLRVFPDGTVKYYERSSAELSNSFHLRRFPFDRQRLEILIHPPVSEAEVVNFAGVAGGPSISIEPRVYSSLAEWAITGIGASGEQIPAFSADTTSQMRFTIAVQRKDSYYLWTIFLPLLLMVILSWTVFWIDTSQLLSQVRVSVKTILAVIMFALAISKHLPKVPYLTFIDVFFLACYVFVFITAIELTVVNIAGRGKNNKMGRSIRRFSRIVFPVLFVLTNLLMIAIYAGPRH